MFRLSLRFLIPLISSLAIIAYLLLPLSDRLTMVWFKKDLDIRSRLVAETLRDSVVPLVRNHSTSKLQAAFDRVIHDERLMAIGFCDPQLNLISKTHTLPPSIDCRTLVHTANDKGTLLDLPGESLHVMAKNIESEGQVIGYLILVHDASFVKRRAAETRWYIFYLFLVLALVVAAVTVIIARISLRGWLRSLEAILRGEGLFKPETHSPTPELRPIVKDLRSLIRDLDSSRSVRDETRVLWSAATLRDMLHKDLIGEEFLIVSNREPYIHVRRGDKIEVQVPASGLVTALEPIMRACSGTWIAHGSGNADKEVVDAKIRVRVPPSEPTYTLRRVWLTPEEEEGYYYGFANEGLWPLCHIAHTRPIFRSSDWNFYAQVNEKFAEAVAQESKTADPVILVQDYHFALLPQLIKRRLPKATIITFWHIPWPNAEAFGICPWREEILGGLLGSSVVGFHTRFHCNNFLETVDRYLECRVDQENTTISYKGSTTAIRHYPISIEWPPKVMAHQLPVPTCRNAVRQRHGLAADSLIGIGVDRLDYTKGIPERLLAVDKLLELYPQWIGKFHFIQISAPSRTKIPQYQNFEKEVTALSERINQKYADKNYKPILLIKEHHEPSQVFEYFRAADLCIVSSLHDGMNLVAKEFVSSRDDERGVLILSQFTGAARELSEAIIVNPYNIDQCAAAIHAALEMPEIEQRERMRSMRSIVREFNVFRWAGRMISEGAKIRRRNRLSLRMNLELPELSPP